jgi:hypothetical protein
MIYTDVRHSDSDRFDREIPSETRELDSRTSDAIHVRLLWHPSDNRVSVAVSDSKTGEAFELTLRDGHSPLEVFHHPFAYAAYRSTETHQRLSPAAAPVRRKDINPVEGGLS